MSKRKQAHERSVQRYQPEVQLDPRQQGLRAFEAERFDQAITIWKGFVQRDASVKAALAEAYFRRALTRTLPEEQVADFQQALVLVADDMRYQYHLGLALHRAGDVVGAIERYRAVLQRSPRWPGAGKVLALATLEQDPQADIGALPSSTPEVSATLAPVQALLQGQPPALNGDTPVDRCWYGMGQVLTQDTTAQTTLDDPRNLPTHKVLAIRRYYQGVAAAQSGDTGAALAHWQYSLDLDAGLAMPWLLENLATVRLQHLTAQLEANDLEGAVGTAQHALTSPIQSAALAHLLVQTLDAAAHNAATNGDWVAAAERWEEARQVVSASSSLGSPRPLLHNLALAYEMQERWMDAAEQWRALFRTQPRRKAGATEDATSAKRWDWVQKRIIECYKNAGQPGAAVTVFRQAIKADPHDLDTRLQLADALLANEQEQASLNELQRILDIDAKHIDARLRMIDIYMQRGEWYFAQAPLRQLIAQQPEREDVLRHIARLLLQQGLQQYQHGQQAPAIKTLEEGWTFAPDNYQFPLNLARIFFNQRKTAKAASFLDRTLELGADQPDAYIHVIESWTIEQNIEAARAVLTRAEATLKPNVEFYISVGLLILNHTTPLTAPTFPSGVSRQRAAVPEATDWSRLATKVLDRALVLKPDEPRIPGVIASELLALRPDLALHYAEVAVRIGAEDPNALLLLGMTQAINEHKREAKETLRRGARLARQQGNLQLAEEIQNLRREVDSPFFGMALQMGPLLDDLDIDDPDFDFDDIF